MYEGKKVFFLLPHEIVREHIIKILSESEYEVYIINDQRKLDSLVNKYPDSIIYVNIDGTLSENEWKTYLKNLIEKYPGLQIGILSGRISDKEMISSYVMEVGINCGVIQLRQGVKECAHNMLKVLEANEARGRRKFLRFSCGYSENISLNFEQYNSKYKGNILDISSVGFSCVFDENPQLSKNEVVPSIQLKLNGVLLTTDCVFVGSRDDGGSLIHVFLYKLSPEKHSHRTKIRSFIYNSLQKKLDKEIA